MTIPLSDYPRPQFKRNSYTCLNGEWEFGTVERANVLSKDNELNIEYLKQLALNEKITVPYPMESSLSGINRRLHKNEVMVYRR